MKSARCLSRPVITAACFLVVAAAIAAAGAPPPAGATARVGRLLGEAGGHLERWNLPEVRKILEEVPGTDDPAVVWLRGVTAFYSGRYDEAEELLSPLSVPGEEGGIMDVVRSSADLSRRLTARRSEHFVVYFDEEKDWVLAGPALETLEAARSALGEWLGHYPGDPVRVEIAPTAEDFEKVSSLSEEEIETSGAIGICKFNRILLLSPRVLLQGYRWRDSLVHEYIHYLLVALSGNRAPIWLQEGVARYGETLWRSPASLHLGRSQESLVARALREDALVPFRSMDPSLVRLPSMEHVQLAFAQCSLAAEHLLETWGAGGLRGLLAALAGGEPGQGSGDALRRSLGVTLEEFEKGVHEAIAGKSFTELPGFMIPGFKVAGAGAAGDDEWDLERWQPLEARRHLKLGDMLRGRGRRDAALVEYRRAMKVAPASPYAINRAAGLLIEMNRDGEAEGLVREAVSIHPGYPTSYTLLGSLLVRSGRVYEAEKAYREYLDINPFDPSPWRELGLLLEARGERDEGMLCLSNAARLGGRFR